MKSVNGVTQLFERWKELAGQRNRDDEFTWTTDELKTGLTSIEWDVQDLEQSNSMLIAFLLLQKKKKRTRIINSFFVLD